MSEIIQIHDLQPSELEEAASILTKAFAKDPVMCWIFGDNYQQGAQAMFYAITQYCMLYGKAFCTAELEAVAIRKLPSDRKFSWWKGLRSGFLPFLNVWEMKRLSD